MATAGQSSILNIDDLSVTYSRATAAVPAVDHVNLAVRDGEVHGLVGESGSGKTSIASAILGVLPPTSSITGSITFAGQDLLRLHDAKRREIRGSLVSFVPQNPVSSLNPVLTIGYQIIETIRAHNRVSKSEATQKAVEALQQVRVPDAQRALKRYPHEFSGGTAQRVLVAMALVNSPRLVVADEPTSALDATVQRQIVELLAGLVKSRGMSMLLISHDMGVVATLSETIAVMYSGHVVEQGPVDQILSQPKHPYTSALVAAAVGEAARVKRSETDPRLLSTCRFLPRCPVSIDACRGAMPELLQVAESHKARCYLAQPETAVVEEPA
jgi:oligopeptide/dipeptide ABC transporter ATP-binding protein